MNTLDCQKYQDNRKDTKESCLAVIRDNNEEPYILIIQEVASRLWGFPKGHVKVGEENKACIHRELCEEVGLQIDKYNHISKTIYYAPYKMKIHFITIAQPFNKIKLHIGDELLDYKWIQYENLRQLVHDSKHNKIRIQFNSKFRRVFENM